MRSLPSDGLHVVCHGRWVPCCPPSLPFSHWPFSYASQSDYVIVYQAFNSAIADYAVEHQRFGGPDYSFERMSWIKPNFTWMMHRCGWASKPGQERVLAITIRREHLCSILEQAVHSSYLPELYSSHTAWKSELSRSEVRLQWDPDHAPCGKKLTRRAVQIGLKGEALRLFSSEQIVSIEDVTSLCREGARKLLEGGDVNELRVPIERVLELEPGIQRRIGADFNL
ncbi:unnamed protein product [Chrysoparadoxa australica]